MPCATPQVPSANSVTSACSAMESNMEVKGLRRFGLYECKDDAHWVLSDVLE